MGLNHSAHDLDHKFIRLVETIDIVVMVFIWQYYMGSSTMIVDSEIVYTQP